LETLCIYDDIVECFVSLACSLLNIAVFTYSRCRWITEIISSCSWHCQGENAANKPHSTWSRSQLFRLLLWDSQRARSCLPLSQAG